MRRYLELTDTDGNAVLINVDFIRYVTVNEYKETIVELNDGDYFTVKQKCSITLTVKYQRKRLKLNCVAFSGLWW